MSGPDSSELDKALVQLLATDSELMTLMPDGVFWDIARQGATRFVLVSLVDEIDLAMYRGRAIEDTTYLVKAVEATSGGTNVKAAAARIDALLEQGTLTVPGYTIGTLQRIARVRITEVDEVDASIMWQHRGGRYQIVAVPQ